MAPTGQASPVPEGDFVDPVTGSQRSDQDLLEDIEVGRLQIEFPQDGLAVEPKAAREIMHRQRQAPAKRDVQCSTQREPPAGHFRRAAINVAGGDHDVARATGRPQVLEERGVVRPVRVEREDVLAASLREAGPIGAAEAGKRLAHQARAMLPYDLVRAIARAAVHDNDLVGGPQGDQRFFQFGEDPVQALRFVQGRDDQAEGAPG